MSRSSGKKRKSTTARQGLNELPAGQPIETGQQAPSVLPGDDCRACTTVASWHDPNYAPDPGASSCFGGRMGLGVPAGSPREEWTQPRSLPNGVKFRHNYVSALFQTRHSFRTRRTRAADSLHRRPCVHPSRPVWVGCTCQTLAFHSPFLRMVPARALAWIEAQHGVWFSCHQRTCASKRGRVVNTFISR